MTFILYNDNNNNIKKNKINVCLYCACVCGCWWSLATIIAVVAVVRSLLTLIQITVFTFLFLLFFIMTLSRLIDSYCIIIVDQLMAITNITTTIITKTTTNQCFDWIILLFLLYCYIPCCSCWCFQPFYHFFVSFIPILIQYQLMLSVYISVFMYLYYKLYVF